MMHAGSKIAKSLIGRAGNRWPQTTGRLAFRLFTRTRRRRDKPEAGGMPDGLAPLMLQTASGVVATWEMPARNPSGCKALLVHGWNSRSAHLMALARSLNAAGTDVVLLDLPGHGVSSGRHLHLGKGIEAVDAAWRHHGPFDTLVGHSFGGAVALNAALGSAMCVPKRRPARLVMIAAPDSMPVIFRWFGRRIGLPEPAQFELERKALSVLGYPLELLVASEQLRDTDLPVLVVHDRDDRDVPYADALRIARAGTHVRLVTTGGLGHRRVLKDKGAHAAIVEFSQARPSSDTAGRRPPARDCA